MIVGTTNIAAFTGETVRIRLTVYAEDGSLEDLTGFVARFSIRKNVTTNNALEKTCTVEGSDLVVNLSSTETATAGNYTYEFRIRLDGETDSLIIGNLTLNRSLLVTI